MTPDRVDPVVIYGVDESEFPQIGKNNTLYYTDNGIYNWKDQDDKYNLIANANT